MPTTYKHPGAFVAEVMDHQIYQIPWASLRGFRRFRGTLNVLRTVETVRGLCCRLPTVFLLVFFLCPFC